MSSSTVVSSQAKSFLLRIRNCSQIVQVCSNGEKFKSGKAQNEIAIIENGSIVVDADGKIAAVGTDAEVSAWLSENACDASFSTDLDGSGHCLVPGLVDGHTHPVWDGNRVGEFAMKLAGATYLEVHAKGGGIHSTVRATRAASEDRLSSLLHQRLDRMLRLGTTTVEAKSGYGLDTETELKMLRVLHKVAHKVDVVGTFLGAHTPPEGQSAAEATEDVVERQITALKDAMDKNEVSPEFIDVFCEKGVFEYEDSRRILQAGKEIGLKINFHGDELHPMQSGKLVKELGALTVSHCEELTEEDIKAMASSSSPAFATLLPTTKYILKLKTPPARDLIANGVPVALGSDFNPNAHCLSMPMTMNMACVTMGMTMNEALVAATINSAASIDRADRVGSLEAGKMADMLLLEGNTWEHLIYEMVDPPIVKVIKNGEIVIQNE